MPVALIRTRREYSEMRTSEAWRGEMAEARKRFGLNQTELAAAITARTGKTLSQSEVSQIENGRRETHWAVLEICNELQLGLPDAVDDLDEANSEMPSRAASTMIAVALSNDELVLLEDWAIEHGYTVGDGRANRSAAIRALVGQLGDS